MTLAVMPFYQQELDLLQEMNDLNLQELDAPEDLLEEMNS
jgi:hypothetical protein